MKSLIGLLILVTASVSLGAEKLYSKAIQQQICAAISSGPDRVSESECLKGEFTFSKDAAKKNLGGEEVTTQMFIAVEIEGKTFDVVLNAILKVNADGELERSGWEVASATLGKLTDEALIKDSFPSSNNVEELVIDELPKKIAKAFDNYVDDERGFFGESDDWEDGDRSYYAIKNSEGQVVGYIVSDSWASESIDVKIFFDAKFDKNGKYVDTISESFGYNE